MKYSLAVLALLSVVSAAQIRKSAPYLTDDGFLVMGTQEGPEAEAAPAKAEGGEKKKEKPWANIKVGREKYSDQLSNGDSADDKEVQDVSDKHDDIVEDWGFGAQRGRTRAQIKSSSEIENMSNIELNEMLNQKSTIKGKKTSDWLCDGDSADDKEIQDTADPADEVVEDFGFSGSRNARGQVRLLQSKIESMSNAELNAMLNKKSKASAKTKKTSDWLCDGDSADDKEIQDTADPEDEIVEDFGFSGSRNGRGQVRLLQSHVDSMSNAELNAMLNQKTAAKNKKTSDWLCDGDSADDKEIQDTADPADEVVEDFGFSGSRNARGQVRLLQSKIESMSNAELNAMLNKKSKASAKTKKTSDWLCDGDSADDKEIQDTADPEDEIVEDFGFSGSRNGRGQVRLAQQKAEGIWAPSVKYSDQLANGDSADDKEVEFEHDPNDLIVDYNGHTNAGYGHTRYDDPEHHYKFDNQHYADNTITNLFPDHFATVPSFAQKKAKSPKSEQLVK